MGDVDRVSPPTRANRIPLRVKRVAAWLAAPGLSALVVGQRAMIQRAGALAGLIGKGMTTEEYYSAIHSEFVSQMLVAYAVGLLCGLPVVAFLKSQRWIEPWHFVFAAMVITAVACFVFLDDWPPTLSAVQDATLFAATAAWGGYVLWRIGYRSQDIAP